MKLPNFLGFQPLQTLKSRMGLPDDRYGSFGEAGGRLTAHERTLLESGEGIEVAISDISTLSDKTLAYKDSRVLLYIRDVRAYGKGRADWYPRYHLANCTTLQEMRDMGRFARYVIASETSGEFAINRFVGSQVRSDRHKLPVCQNCLDLLSFKGFRLRDDRQTRTSFVGSFIPEHFFAVYPRSLHSQRPRFSSASAPIDNYPANFDEISRSTRVRVGWRCRKCERTLSDPSLRRFLHVHHRNGNRQDNRDANLVALCIGCHAEEPMHGHLRAHPDYQQYLQYTRSHLQRIK
jgi:hypothetical protein